MSSTTQTIGELAGEAFDQFETAKRPDGDEFTRTKDGAPEWLRDLVREAHGEFLPDDWRYEAIRAALGAIHDAGAETADDLDDLAHEFADGHVDVYNHARLKWVSSHLARASYVDRAREELGAPDADLFDQLGLGQYQEALEVFASVRQSLESVHEDE